MDNNVDNNSRNQHYIPQALINRWKVDDNLSVFFLKEGVSKNVPSNSIFGSKSIMKLRNNKKIEDYLNSTKIEDNFNKLTDEIIEGKYRLNRDEIKILQRYSVLLCTFEDCFWWNNEIKIIDKQKALIDSIIKKADKGTGNYFIYENPVEPFVLTKSSYRLRYNNHIVFPITPSLCIGLGDDLIKGRGKIDVNLNKHLNEDAISQGRCGDYIVYSSIDTARLKAMCEKDRLEGNFILLLIDGEMAKEVYSQGIKSWNPGEYLICPGYNQKYAINKCIPNITYGGSITK
jgi:hypothetical protein